MRYGWLAVVAALVLGGCATGEAAESAVGWRTVADGPLGPREQSLGLWTGREVLIFGGSDAPPCPPNASCAMDPTPLLDGAALDPATGTWRTLSDSPVSLLSAQGVVVGSKAFLLPYAVTRRLVVYDIDRDTWDRLPAPFDPQSGYQLVAAGPHVVAYGGSDEVRPGQDYLLDPRTGKWTALPDDPLGPAWDRAMTWTGRELVLFDHELIPNPGAEGPTLTRAAVFDPGSRAWRRLPESPMLSTGPWLATGGRLVNPALGTEDGGEVGNWGRDVPYGGILDPASGAWSPLPEAPSGGGGALDGTSALYPGLVNHVLDTRSGQWQTVPAPPGDDTSGHTVVTAGRELVLFGGAHKHKTLVGTTSIWTPKS
ncbi:hypothetical protein JIG36_01280 [Actinoplanes sp. LDG1-06]|uniref:Galactose oxidase n=1 Tax=Paractinoplanes ovalisporus TaxID=2810368 RepID=A0ABS2A2W6_9ACTN|nr:hypothetical protein [Actinoplanes ovalisporus]MBM2614187.1 hypothetical protein [Actinoplanes ovalisporus]